MHEAADREQFLAGQAVNEPFSGSGTTIIAAEITGRSCHAIELLGQYVDVAVHAGRSLPLLFVPPGSAKSTYVSVLFPSH